MKKILIVKTSALGDIVHVFPSIRFIKEQFPNVSIDWVVEKKNALLVSSNPYVNRSIEFDRKNFSFKGFLKDLRKEYYDLVIDFQGNLKSGLMTGFSRGALKVGFDWNSVSEKPNLLFTHLHAAIKPGLNAREEYLSLAEQALGIKAKSFPEGTLLNLPNEDLEKLHVFRSNQKQIMVCPGSLWPNKKASQNDLTAFLKKIPDTKFWLLYGSEQEKREAEDLSLSLKNSATLGGLSFPLLQHIMKEMDLVIAMDSFPLHLAGEAGVPTFSIFGASSSHKFKPLGHPAFQGECPYGQTFVRRCPKLRTCKTGACIHHLPENALFHSFSLDQNSFHPLQ